MQPCNIEYTIFRNYVKALVNIIISHEKFDTYWVTAIKDETKVKNLQRIINSLK